MSETAIDGLALRDYLAAKAMPFVYEKVRDNLIHDDEWDDLDELERGITAEQCYSMADAMLKARSIPPEDLE